MQIPWRGIQFGLGLLEIGRPWGFRPVPVPDHDEAVQFLREAHELGVRVFDTAPSYHVSEEKLGAFLKTLSAAERSSVVVATKFGETWDAENDEPVVDHSYDALMRSLDRSFALLGRIDILQVHKSTPDVLRSSDLHRALEAAARAGVGLFGASVKDAESIEIACSNARFSLLQFPYNRLDTQFLPALREARSRGRLVFVNRPFGMGRLLQGNGSHEIRECLEAILAVEFDGAILAGTRSAEHLRQNLEAFRSPGN